MPAVSRVTTTAMRPMSARLARGSARTGLGTLLAGRWLIMTRLSRISSAKRTLVALSLAPLLLLFSGCIGRPDVSPGGVCQSEGEAKPAPDGCNTCTCSDGTWACTEKACVETCEDGDTKGSGCNACVCQAGDWSCTLQLCPPPGDECFEGEEKDAEDGCNTCSCSDGKWVCTKRACIDPVCEDGDTKPSGDGCNTCECDGGEWSCTERTCLLQECEDGSRKMGNDGCTCDCVDQRWLCPEGECNEQCTPGEAILAGDGCNTCTCGDDGRFGTCTLLSCSQCLPGQVKPMDDGCNTCSCSLGYWACTNRVCPELKCQDGDSEPSGDGCNSCSCSQGYWICTDRACPECQEGERNTDGCNECTCAGGFWACTERICEGKLCWGSGACADDEYCAYVEGEHCGAADATSICKPRPDICPAVDEPVCGCDGNDYSNACLAAQSGTGVYQLGECR